MNPGGRFRQAGFAYLMALLVLAALAGVGIALSRLAIAERRLGANFRGGIQALNSAESGLAVAEARLVEADRSDAIEFVFAEASESGALRIGNRVVVEGVVPVAVAPCNLCDLGRPQRFHRVDYAVTSTGEVRAWRSGESPELGRLLASFSVEATVTVQPWRSPEVALAEDPSGESR